MDIIKEILDDMDSIDYRKTTSFTVDAFDRLKFYILYFMNELYYESIRNSKREKKHKINKEHVIKAAEYLTHKPRRKLNGILKNISSIALGVSITFILSPLLFKSTYSPGGYVLLIILTIISIFVFVYSNLKL